MAPASAVAPVFNPAKLIPILLWRDAHQVAAPSCLKGEPDESRKSLKLMVNTAKSSAIGAATAASSGSSHGIGAASAIAGASPIPSGDPAAAAVDAPIALAEPIRSNEP